MISTLLWRCPECKTPEAVQHQKQRRKPDIVTCTACQTRWDLIRDFGGPDYKMKVRSGVHEGKEAPVSAWYDQMLEGLELKSIDHPDWPIQDSTSPNEILHLTTPVKDAFTFPEDPVFQDEKFTKSEGVPMPNGMISIGPGMLAFTSERLVYVLSGGAIISLPWVDLAAADTLIDVIFTIKSGERFIFFMLDGQSVLKWLVYSHLKVAGLNLGEDRSIHLGSI